MPADVAGNNARPGERYELGRAVRTGQNPKALATVSTNVTNMTTSGSGTTARKKMAVLKVQNIFPERRDGIEQGRTRRIVESSRTSATLPSRPRVQTQSPPLQFTLTGKMPWYHTMISAQFPLLPASTATIPLSSSPQKKQPDSRFSPLEALDHRSLTCFSEILLPDSAGSPTQEYDDDMPSDHVAYGLVFVDDYIAPPSGDVHASTDCDRSMTIIDPETDVRPQCDSCGTRSLRPLMPCKCCRDRLCENCFGPCLADFRFPRIPKDKSGVSPRSQQGGPLLKDLCERCVRSCAGPHKQPGCRVKEPHSAKSPRRREMSPQWSHRRQLTQLSITAINATNTNNTTWSFKIITFLWRVTTFTLHSLNLQHIFRSESDRLRITDSEDYPSRRIVRSESEASVALIEHTRRARDRQLI
ncbi:hypothetical protein V1517DRAFT_319718 [Lipomyces orientalis]|uniref:Uncharacterized protein n=1 Tax=Lipomyces orientalis TaxID=1233043 RepID=A0ACC3TUB5_9ASCO